MNILFTCAGRRTYLLKYFKEQLGNNDKILGADMQLTAPALSVADIKLQVPAVYAIDYIDRVLEICVEYHVDLVISLNDLELPILSKATDRFKAIGTFPLVSSERVIDICFDKYKTAQFVENLGLYSPKTFVDYDKAVEAINNGELQFPLCLKPRWGSGSIGIEYVEDMEELA
jgi:carbamoyl-phosphate synthase large subunit